MSCECVHNCSTEESTLKCSDKHHRVGPTVKFQSNLYDTISQVASLGSYTIQFFLGGTTTYTSKGVKVEDKRKTAKYCDDNDQSFYVHSPLVANLSKPHKDIHSNKSILFKSLTVMKKQICSVAGLPAGCVLHTGSKGSLPDLVENLNFLRVPRGTHHRGQKLLLLENSAGNSKNTSLGANLDDYRKIYEGLDNNTVGLCIDTQHLFGAGVNKLSTHQPVWLA